MKNASGFRTETSLPMGSEAGEEQGVGAVLPGRKRTGFIGYWTDSVKEFSQPKKLAFAGLMLALSVVLQAFTVPIDAGGTLKMQFTFFISALSGVVCGPLLSLIRGAAADVIGFFVFPSGYAFFPGYTLSAMLGATTYSLFFWKRKISFASVFFAKAVNNVLINAALGSVWTYILYSAKKAYLVYFGLSFVKNILLLPLEVLVIVLLFRALLPVLFRMKMIETPPSDIAAHKTALIVVCAAALLLAVVVYFFGSGIYAFFKGLIG